MAGQRGSAAGQPSGRRAARPARQTAAPGRGVQPPDTGRKADRHTRGPGAPGGGQAGDRAAHQARVRSVVEPVVVEAGYDLESLAVSRVGRRHLLRIAVDSDNGVDLDAVAELSRRISAALDEAEAGGDELIAGEYELEVGSPGVDRPLTQPRHWRRSRGRLVQVRVDDRQLTGRVSGADDEGVTLDVDGAAHRLEYERLGPGKVQIEFKRPAGQAEDRSEDDEFDDNEFDDDEFGEDDEDEDDEDDNEEGKVEA